MEPDLARSAQLLEDAGWERGDDGVYAKDGERLELSVRVVSGWTDYITTVDAMTEQLAEAGIALTPQQSSWNEWSDARGRGDYQLIIDSLPPGPTADPYWQYANHFYGANATEVGETANTNWTRYVSPDVDEVVDRLRLINPDDAAAREPYFDTIQTTIEQDMPYIPVLLNGTISIWNTDKFTGWPTEDDLYAYPALWQSPDGAQVMKNLELAGTD
jgi:peptide/nickel transport system substrate-binding protein